MKEWMEVLKDTRILAPADIRNLFFVWKLGKLTFANSSVFLTLLKRPLTPQQSPDIHGT